MRVLVLLFSPFLGVAVFSAGGAEARALADNEIAAAGRSPSAARTERSTLIAGVARVLLGERGLNRPETFACALFRSYGMAPRGHARRAKTA